MKSFLLVLLGLVLGGVMGVLLGTGLGAGAGIVTGMQAGACLVVEAAKEKGLISADQVDGIFAAAAQSLAVAAKGLKADADWGTDTPFADSDAECQAFVAKLKQNVAEQP